MSGNKIGFPLLKNVKNTQRDFLATITFCLEKNEKQAKKMQKTALK